MAQNVENIRNFVIIAHIDHGKSTLADRMLEVTGTVEARKMKEQYLDSLELERERGITIKMAPVRMQYKQNGHELALNLIDTPGHSDFGYEVSRALAAVEGAILLVDATQGIQAQTLATFESAKKAGLSMIGAVNKVDVASPAQIDEAVTEIAELLQIDTDDIHRVSGKTGVGVEDLLAAIIKTVPSPEKSEEDTARALVFDSLYDEHKGVIAFVRMFAGAMHANDTLHLLATNSSCKAKEVGYFSPELKSSERINNGETGYIATGIKNPTKLRIGDTIASKGNADPLPGYQEPSLVVFVSFYPEDASDYDDLKFALDKLRLTDASLRFEPDMSEALGRGFKGGFLGRLHFEITAERLDHEFGIETVHSFPSVAYKVKRRNQSDFQLITNPKDFPEDAMEIMEPITSIEILTPSEYLGQVLRLNEVFRFSDITTETIGAKSLIKARLPLADLVSDLDDKLKSSSKGYASLSYKIVGFENAEVEKMDILLEGSQIPGLTRIVPKKDVVREGRATVEKLKKLLPAQQFKQALQAAVGSNVVARENIAAAKKNVTGHLYGGDRTRKMKLWKKQQKGKKKLKERAGKSSAKIPASVFKELLKK